MFKPVVLAAIAFTSLASAAVAQTSQTPSPTPTPTPSGPSDFMSVIPRGSSEMYMSFGVPTRLVNQVFTDQSRAKASPAEWRRANKAARLINDQQCGKAYTLAVVEMDDRLAQGVKRVCHELSFQ